MRKNTYVFVCTIKVRADTDQDAWDTLSQAIQRSVPFDVRDSSNWLMDEADPYDILFEDTN